MKLSYLTGDLLFSSQVTAQAAALGMEIDVVGSAEKLIVSAGAEQAVVLIDLSQPGLDVAATTYTSPFTWESSTPSSKVSN